MDDNKDIVAEAERIINDSAEAIETEHKAKQLHHFVQIESQMYKEFGFSDEDAYLFHMTMIANTAEEVEKLRAERKEENLSRIIPPDNPDEEANRAMQVKCVVSSGDVYDILRNRNAALQFANQDNGIGCIIRVAAFQSAKAMKEGVKPSEATDKQDAIVTIMITEERIQTISRICTDSEQIHTQVIEIESYEPDKERLLDALVTYFIFPRMMKHEEPTLFNALLKDYEEKS
jgi:hypothetical protein